MAEQPGGAVAGIGFSHLLGQRAVYGDLSPARRRRLHQRAAGLVDRNRALGHRVAAAVGPDDGLAAELEAAARESRWHGRTVQAAGWLAQAAAVSGEPEAADRRLLDALEILVTCGDVAQAEVLAVRAAAAGPGARRSWLLGTLDFLAGRIAAAEARLLEAWQAHDPAGEAAEGAGAAFWLAVLCLFADRLSEAIEWGERAAAAGAAPAAARHRALGVLAIALVAAGRGPEGLARLAFLPPAPSQVPREDTDTLALRGMARVLTEDLAAAVADLSAVAARLRAGVPLLTASRCLSYLAVAEWRLGCWDDAVVHAELAVSLARDADRAWELGPAHFVAAVVPTLRGDWAAASAHVEMATQAAGTIGAPRAIAAAATARAFLAMARGDLEGVTDAAAVVRATGRAQLPSLLPYGWRSLEIEALIGLGRVGAAGTALAELEAVLPPAGSPSALVDAARLRGDLATAAGHPAAAAAASDRLAPPRACGYRWHWPSWRSPTPVGYARPAQRPRGRSAGHGEAQRSRTGAGHLGRPGRAPTPRSPLSSTSASARSAPTWTGSGTRPAAAAAPT